MAVKKRQKALSSGRPPTGRPKERMKSDVSRTIINTHHRLQKEQAAAAKRGDAQAVARLTKEIEANGGIKLYQAASKQGQANDRGGDSSRVLVEWLQQSSLLAPSRSREPSPMRCLEVGALSTKNAISNWPKSVVMTRIDLNSQGAGILKQDFMERPLPQADDERFDLISLSLVLNYVPDATGRGEMLKRIPQFLRKSESTEAATFLPLLFLVLPRPCIDNSRYLDEKLLQRILLNLGAVLKQKKHTAKLSYYLFSFTEPAKFSKTEKKKLRDGPGMNNFAIIVE